MIVVVVVVVVVVIIITIPKTEMACVGITV